MTLRPVAPPPNPFGEQETDNFQEAFDRGFYMVLERRRDNDQIARMLYGGNNIDKARATFADIVRRRPRGRWTLQQRTQVLQKWPEACHDQS